MLVIWLILLVAGWIFYAREEYEYAMISFALSALVSLMNIFNSYIAQGGI